MEKIRLSSHMTLFYKITGALTALLFIILSVGAFVYSSDNIVLSIVFLVLSVPMSIRVIKLKTVWFDKEKIYFKGLFKQESISLKKISQLERSLLLMGWTIHLDKNYSKLTWILFQQPYFSNFNWALYTSQEKRTKWESLRLLEEHIKALKQPSAGNTGRGASQDI